MSSAKSEAAYDYVIVGAGSAGCVLAARLSEDPGARVLLLEAGTAKEPLAARVPIAFSQLFRTEHDWAFETEPEAELGGRRLYMPRGKLLGGSSALNAMVYIRGNRADFDAWVAQGADGWSYADVLPYFMVQEDQARGASALHGVGGPLRVEDLRSPNPLSSVFVEACVECGLVRNDDFNGLSQEGAGFYQVTQRNGRRESAATAFLFPALRRPNLHVSRGTLALRLLFEGDRATHVEYGRGRELARVRALREIILCAGAVGSPHLLLLSGIGAQFELARVGISTKVDLPGVGKNLQDHPITPMYWQSKAPLSLLNADKVGARLEYFMFRRGPLTSNVAEAGAFVRSPGAGSLPNLQYHFAPVMYLNHGLQQPEAHGFTIGATLIAPMSRGQLTLRSADPLMPPLIVGNHLSHPADRKALAYGIELARELCAAKAFDAHRGPEHWPAFADAPSTVDSAVLDQHMRATTELLYHPVGTCRMGKDELSVVDPELRVRRVRGLSVADASVMPTITRGNTNAATLMLAERLATLIQV